MSREPLLVRGAALQRLIDLQVQQDRSDLWETLSADVEKKVPRRRHPCRLKIRKRQFFLDGVLVPMELTQEKTDDALAFVGELIKEPGSWKSGPDIGKATHKEGVRFDKVKKVLPEPIKSLIESNRRKGYQWAGEVGANSP
jgi:hypothetical protein